MIPISITMAYGEKGPRSDALQVYLMDHPKEYDFCFGDVEVDLVFSRSVKCADEVYRGNATNHFGNPEDLAVKFRAVELKMPQDLVASLQPDPQTGRCHLDDQRRQCPYPLQVAVLGSLGDVLRAIPEVTGKGWRNPRERMQAEGMIRRGIAALKASGVDVSFGHSPRDIGTPGDDQEAMAEWALKQNMAQVVREARAYLESDIRLPRAKCESVQEAMLMTLPGIGPERARAILDSGYKMHIRRTIEPGLYTDDFCLDLDVPGIGKKTAERILESMR